MAKRIEDIESAETPTDPLQANAEALAGEVETLKTVSDLQWKVSTHSDVGVAGLIGKAIDNVIEEGDIEIESELSEDTLGQIRSAIYGLGEEDSASFLPYAVISAQSGGSGNIFEDALRYIEDLGARVSHYIPE
jgi:hypothetical protein